MKLSDYHIENVDRKDIEECIVSLPRIRKRISLFELMLYSIRTTSKFVWLFSILLLFYMFQSSFDTIQQQLSTMMWMVLIFCGVFLSEVCKSSTYQMDELESCSLNHLTKLTVARYFMVYLFLIIFASIYILYKMPNDFFNSFITSTFPTVVSLVVTLFYMHIGKQNDTKRIIAIYFIIALSTVFAYPYWYSNYGVLLFLYGFAIALLWVETISLRKGVFFNGINLTKNQ